MTEQLYRACADVLSVAVQLPSAAQLPPANELRQRMIQSLDGMVLRGRALGIPDAELAEARYALVAFTDEQILKSNWPGKNEWMNQPLQLALYREYTAGENFFVRLRALLQSGRPALALEVYYLCLMLGFRGAYGKTGDVQSVNTWSEAARQQLKPTLPDASKLGPHAQPQDRGRVERTNKLALILLIAGCVVVSVVVLFGLKALLDSNLQEATSVMVEPTGATQPTGNVRF